MPQPEENPGSRKPHSEVWAEHAFVRVGAHGVKPKLCATPDSGSLITHEDKNNSAFPTVARKKDRKNDRSTKFLLYTPHCAFAPFADGSCSEAAPWWQRLSIPPHLKFAAQRQMQRILSQHSCL